MPQHWKSKGLTGSLVAVALVMMWTTAVSMPRAVQASPLGQTTTTCTSTSTQFVANLTGSQEVPPTGSAATGVATLQLQPDGTTLFVNLVTSNLNLPTVTASHIHSPAPVGVTAPIRVDFFTGPVGGFGNPHNVVVTVPADVLADMRNGLAYVNIHTQQFPTGEIRGQIACAAASTVTPTATVVANNINTIRANLVAQAAALGAGPCANQLNQICQITGGITGNARVSGSMAVTATVPAGIIATGALANIFFNTTTGIEFITCPAAVAGVATTCVGTTVGNIIQGSLARAFAGGVQVATGTVIGPGVAAPIPPPPPIVIPPPPPPQIIPLVPPVPAAVPGAMTAAAAAAAPASAPVVVPTATPARSTSSSTSGAPASSPSTSTAPSSSSSTTTTAPSTGTGSTTAPSTGTTTAPSTGTGSSTAAPSVPPPPAIEPAFPVAPTIAPDLAPVDSVTPSDSVAPSGEVAPSLLVPEEQ